MAPKRICGKLSCVMWPSLSKDALPLALTPGPAIFIVSERMEVPGRTPRSPARWSEARGLVEADEVERQRRRRQIHRHVRAEQRAAMAGEPALTLAGTFVERRPNGS